MVDKDSTPELLVLNRTVTLKEATGKSAVPKDKSRKELQVTNATTRHSISKVSLRQFYVQFSTAPITQAQETIEFLGNKSPTQLTEHFRQTFSAKMPTASWTLTVLLSYNGQLPRAVLASYSRDKPGMRSSQPTHNTLSRVASSYSRFL